MNILPLMVQMSQTVDEVPLKKKHKFFVPPFINLSDSDLYSGNSPSPIKYGCSSSRPYIKMTELFSC